MSVYVARKIPKNSDTDDSSRASDARVEATLNHISHALGSLRNHIEGGTSQNSVQEHLSELQRSQNTILSQLSAANSHLHGIPGLAESALRSAPATILETSQHFFPEKYTLESQIPDACLTALGAYEQYSNANVVINCYRLLHRKSAREWQWLTIYIEVQRCSKYWAVIKIAQAWKWFNPVLASSALLPRSLITQIPVLVCQTGNSRDAQPSHFSLFERLTFDRKTSDPCPDMILEIAAQRRLSSDALACVHDLGCARYVESQVIQLEIIDQPSRFRSCINGILVYEIKCMDIFPSADFLYNIRVLHCMKGASGFARLVGVVTDDESTYLKSYLIEYPKARFNILHSAEDLSIRWNRREKWAIQLIQGLSRIHEQGFTVGGLCSWKISLILNNTDSVLFWDFAERIIPGRTIGAYYPPELCYLRDMPPGTNEADRVHVTSKMDIFHLGLLLWLLAESKAVARASPVCMRRGCTPGVVACDLSHIEPIALPQLPESIPRYYRDIVNSCRAEEPRDRPAAREMLQNFPTVGDTSCEIEPQEPYDADPNVLGEGLRMNWMFCDLCSKRTTYQQIPFFHCNLCQNGDFDLCQTCFEGGAHCDDDDHLMVELGKIGSWILPRKYHSCIKSSGHREVIDL